jgi:5-methyltetrahydrofolate--homocysteine methyltransferase
MDPIPSDPLPAMINNKDCILADGATGTNLFNMGLTSGDAPELWNKSAPEKN